LTGVGGRDTINTRTCTCCVETVRCRKPSSLRGSSHGCTDTGSREGSAPASPVHHRTVSDRDETTGVSPWCPRPPHSALPLHRLPLLQAPLTHALTGSGGRSGGRGGRRPVMCGGCMLRIRTLLLPTRATMAASVRTLLTSDEGRCGRYVS